MNYNEYMKRLNFWEILSIDEKEEILNNTVARTLKKGEVFDNDADKDLGVIILLNGKLHVFMETEDYNHLTLFELNENDVCVLSVSSRLNLVDFKTKIYVTADTKILAINALSMENIVKNNYLVKMYIYELLKKRMSMIINMFENMLCKKFYKRLAEYILNKYLEKREFKIKINKTAIAREMNSAREVVSRNFKLLQNNGILKNGRDYVIIIDIDKLYKAVENDY